MRYVHPSIVRLYDVCETPNRVMIISLLIIIKNIIIIIDLLFLRIL